MANVRLVEVMVVTARRHGRTCIYEEDIQPRNISSEDDLAE